MDAGQTWMVGGRVEAENNSVKRKDREVGRVLRESLASGGSMGHLQRGPCTGPPTLKTPLTEKQSMVS